MYHLIIHMIAFVYAYALVQLCGGRFFLVIIKENLKKKPV